MTEIQNLLSQLQDKGWSKAAIADAVKLNWYTIYRWCRGETIPKNQEAVRQLLLQLLQQKQIPKKRRYGRKPAPPTA
jgi:ribosome-binding protein aMBF1 (putative translation factor)